MVDADGCRIKVLVEGATTDLRCCCPFAWHNNANVRSANAGVDAGLPRHRYDRAGHGAIRTSGTCLYSVGGWSGDVLAFETAQTLKRRIGGPVDRWMVGNGAVPPLRWVES